MSWRFAVDCLLFCLCNAERLKIITGNLGCVFFFIVIRTQKKQLFAALFRKWPKFSGSVVYPVPASNDNLGDPGSAYDYAQCTLGDMYSGEYGALRLELLDFCINELKPITRWSPQNGN